MISGQNLQIWKARYYSSLQRVSPSIPAHVSCKQELICLFILIVKVSKVLQAAWLRFQEVQALHQRQADPPYQEVPAGGRKEGQG